MVSELSIIKINEDIPDGNDYISSGSIGTIVHIHKNEKVEIEFAHKVVTVNLDKIKYNVITKK